jgi:predicted nuclease with TOPRIM domain
MDVRDVEGGLGDLSCEIDQLYDSQQKLLTKYLDLNVQLTNVEEEMSEHNNKFNKLDESILFILTKLEYPPVADAPLPFSEEYERIKEFTKRLLTENVLLTEELNAIKNQNQILETSLASKEKEKTNLTKTINHLIKVNNHFIVK